MSKRGKRKPETATPKVQSNVVRTAERLANAPLSAFGVEELRFAIGQRMRLDDLMDLAVPELERDPFVAGSFYRGDLLVSVLRTDVAFWKKNHHHVERVEKIVKTVRKHLDEHPSVQR